MYEWLCKQSKRRGPTCLRVLVELSKLSVAPWAIENEETMSFMVSLAFNKLQLGQRESKASEKHCRKTQLLQDIVQQGACCLSHCHSLEQGLVMTGLLWVLVLFKS